MEQQINDSLSFPLSLFKNIITRSYFKKYDKLWMSVYSLEHCLKQENNVNDLLMVVGFKLIKLIKEVKNSLLQWYGMLPLKRNEEEFYMLV